MVVQRRENSVDMDKRTGNQFYANLNIGSNHLKVGVHYSGRPLIGGNFFERAFSTMAGRGYEPGCGNLIQLLAAILTGKV